jgi:hypothetical protein
MMDRTPIKIICHNGVCWAVAGGGFDCVLAGGGFNCEDVIVRIGLIHRWKKLSWDGRLQRGQGRFAEWPPPVSENATQQPEYDQTTDQATRDLQTQFHTLDVRHYSPNGRGVR